MYIWSLLVVLLSALNFNIYGPPYARWEKGQKQSGVYDDTETLKGIWQKFQHSLIDDNRSKAATKQATAWKEKFKADNKQE